MDISRDLRRSNIAEYILYLWQLEGLLRVLQFSPEAIYSQFVAPRSELSPEAQHELLGWYVGYCDRLEEEGKRIDGHWSHTLHLIGELQDLHLRLLGSSVGVGARYRVLWSRLEGVLGDLRSVEGFSGDGVSDIELCFRALYGGMLMKIKGVGGALGDVLEYVSPVIAELSSVYHRAERGECDLFAAGS